MGNFIKDIIGEVWKDIEGFEGYYQVSSQGRVKSLDRTILRANGRKHTWRGQLLSLKPSSTTGYARVCLRKNGRSSFKDVHRLVALAFIPNPGSLPLVLHADGTRTNNSVENLRWGTTGDNLRDAVKHGTYRNGWGEKTHCKNGHSFDEENTYHTGRQRQCRTCNRDNQRRYKARRALRKVA